MGSAHMLGTAVCKHLFLTADVAVGTLCSPVSLLLCFFPLAFSFFLFCLVFSLHLFNLSLFSLFRFRICLFLSSPLLSPLLFLFLSSYRSLFLASFSLSLPLILTLFLLGHRIYPRYFSILYSSLATFPTGYTEA